MGNQCNQCVGNNSAADNSIQVSKPVRNNTGQFSYIGIFDAELAKVQDINSIRIPQQALKTIEQKTFRKSIIGVNISSNIQSQNKQQIKPQQQQTIWKVKQPQTCYVYTDKKVKQTEDGLVRAYFVNDQSNEFIAYYQGQLKKAQIYDKDALVVFPDGGYFLGSVKHSVASGKGNYVNFNKNVNYQGQWKNNLPNGKGIMKAKDYIYQGDFVDGKKKGKGIIQWQNSDVSYDGDFQNDNMHGSGKLTRDGFTYQGDFVNGKFQGKGRWQKKSYSYYGQFKNGLRDGVGQLKFQSGKIYYGDFKNDVPHGKGTLKKNLNSVGQDGIWINGKMMCLNSN